MPTILVRDPTLLERLNKLKPVPSDYYDDILYELLKRAESANRLAIRGLDNLPQLVVEEVRKTLDGKLVESIRAALLPAVSNVTLEIPVELSIKVRLRLEPVFDVAPIENPTNNNENDGGVTTKIAEIDELERRALQYLKEHGGCWEGSAYSLAKQVAGDVNWALETRLRRRLIKRDGKICLPDVVQ